MDTIKITLQQLKTLLNQQKGLTAKRLLASTSSFNPKNTPGHSYSMDIDKEKFERIAMDSEFPDEIKTLSKYLD